MTSETDVTYHSSTILSVNDPRIEKFKWKVGDRFVLKMDSSFDEGLIKSIGNDRCIIEIRGFGITIQDELLYDIKVIEPYSLDYHWFVSEDILDNAWKTPSKSTRFLTMEV